MEIMDFHRKMRTGSLICVLVRKCLCVSISRGKPSIYFLLNIGYVVYVVYVIYVVVVVAVYVVHVVHVVYVLFCHGVRHAPAMRPPCDRHAPAMRPW